MPAECGSHVASGDRLMEARRSLLNEGGGPDDGVSRPALSQLPADPKVSPPGPP